MQFLVTGGAGFIGSHIVEEIIGLRHRVVVIDDLSTGNLQNIEDQDQCLIYTQRIQDVESDLLREIDGIFHMAAQSSVPLSIEDFYASSKNNILGALRVFEIARSIDVPVVYASSSAIYGELTEGNDYADLVDLPSPYAVDKYALEQYAKVACRLYGVSSVGLRFFNIYGPRQDPQNPYSGVISIFIEKSINNGRIVVNGGQQTRDFVYVKDAAKMAVRAMEILTKGDLCEQVNICTGKSVSINYLLDTIMTMTQKRPEVEYRELPPGDPEVSLGSCEKMVSFFDMGLDEFTQLREGVGETVEYVRGIVQAGL